MNYIIDTKTTNKSFIEMHYILKNMGIKNNKFFLKLYDKDLQGVDPYSKNLTPVQEIKIYNECVKNPYYFIREVVRIPIAGGNTRYKLHRGNLAMNFCMLNNLNIIEMLPRQHGKTIGAVVIYIWIYYFGTLNSDILFLNRDLGAAKLNLRRFKDITELLPKYLIVKSVDDVDNIEGIENGTNGNTIEVLSGSTNETAADKKGRGATTPLQYWDEFAFLKHNATMYKSSAPAASQAMLSAKANGKPYGKLITTTPNNVDIDEGRECKTMIDNAAPFDEAIYDWSRDEIDKYLEVKSTNDFIYIEFSYKQLGRDNDWFKSQCRQLNNDKKAIAREVLLEWTRSSDDSIYDEEDLIGIEEKITDPLFSIRIRKYHKFSVYEEIDLKTQYLIAIDPSTGSGKDSTAISVINPYSFKPVAEFRDNNISSTELRLVIIDLVMGYFPNSLVVIENNSIGKVILDFLITSPISRNLYYEDKYVMAEEVEYSKKDIITKKNKKKRKIYGINTNKTSRQLMFEILDEAVRYNPEEVATINLYNEIRTLVRDKSGRPEAREGNQDDSIMSYLIGRYAISYGTNLNKFFRHIRIANENKAREMAPDSSIEKLDIMKNRENTTNRIISSLKNANTNDDYNFSKYLEKPIIEKCDKVEPIANKSNKLNFYNNLLNILDK